MGLQSDEDSFVVKGCWGRWHGKWDTSGVMTLAIELDGIVTDPTSVGFGSRVLESFPTQKFYNQLVMRQIGFLIANSRFASGPLPGHSWTSGHGKDAFGLRDIGLTADPE